MWKRRRCGREGGVEEKEVWKRRQEEKGRCKKGSRKGEGSVKKIGVVRTVSRAL